MGQDADIAALIDRYAAGADQLRESLAGLSVDQLNLSPIAGLWSFREVVCHIADFETINANRMKRVIAEDNPVLTAADENLWASRLYYDVRIVAEELDLISRQRSQVSRILRQLDVESFQRTGVHSEDGPMTLERLLERATRHIPHHLEFIRNKSAALS